MLVSEYQIKTPYELKTRIGIVFKDGTLLDPNLVWRGDYEREGFLSCKDKADRVIPEGLAELLTFSDNPIDSLRDSYGLYLFLQKVGVDSTLEGFSFLKEVGSEGISLPAIAEIPWTYDEEKIDVEVGIALMTSGEATNLDSEKAHDHLFALNLYQKFGDLITYGKYWVTVDDFEDLPGLKFSILKNDHILEELTLTGYINELSESLSAHSKKGWILPGDIIYLKSSQKTVAVEPGDQLELNIPEIMNLKNNLGTPIKGKLWEI
ncbi:MAG: hypothetical protein DRQ88_07175 [Epsilonproteobacteria bacterium]|nr:MAG: hypothetical protein DRQ88_07175 [Campylobacterota bacterium]